MASPSQKRGGCGHLMAEFDSHSSCVRCRKKGKWPDPCVSKSDCNLCNVLNSDQRLQLSAPSYKRKKLKKGKRQSKKSDKNDTPTKAMDSDSSSLVDLALGSVVGAVDGQGMLQSPSSSSSSKEKMKKVICEEKAKIPASKPAKSPSDKLAKSATDSRLAKPSTEDRIAALHQKWSDRFHRLEALLLARRLEKPELTFQPVKVMSTHTPPGGFFKATDPFIKPANRPQSLSQSITDQHPQICLVRPPQFYRDRLPVNCQGTKRRKWIDRLQICLAPTLLLNSNRLPVNQLLNRPEDNALSVDTETDSDMSDRPELSISARTNLQRNYEGDPVIHGLDTHP